MYSELQLANSTTVQLTLRALHPPSFFRSTNTGPYIININTINNYDNVYGAIIMTKVIARVHPVHLMNVD